MYKPYLDKFANLREKKAEEIEVEVQNEVFTKESKGKLLKNGIRSVYEKNGFIEILNQKNETISFPVDNYLFLDSKSISLLQD
mmetsp:Transcript_26973/g.20180  ORF Transcript_26973/g.20180 Transcript_26973/m.20180 type:complete len:83 (-) Transcript_26973:666-914(-)